MSKCDLHIHSIYSDGNCTPSEIVKDAKRLGVRCISLTDHDTVAGIPEVVAAGKEFDIEIIPGIEVSAESDMGSVHVLGYFVQADNEDFKKEVTSFQENRHERNLKIIQKFNDFGIHIELEELQNKFPAGQIGRPHFAHILVDKGYVGSYKEAFDRFLGDGRPVHIRNLRPTVKEAIDLIHMGGGISSLAHPIRLNPKIDKQFEETLRTFKEFGLDALECYSGSHSREAIKRFIQLTEQYDLLVTGGSDFHSKNKLGVELGCSRDNLFIPYELVEKLKIFQESV